MFDETVSLPCQLHTQTVPPYAAEPIDRGAPRGSSRPRIECLTPVGRVPAAPLSHPKRASTCDRRVPSHCTVPPSFHGCLSAPLSTLPPDAPLPLPVAPNHGSVLASSLLLYVRQSGVPGLPADDAWAVFQHTTRSHPCFSAGLAVPISCLCRARTRATCCVEWRTLPAWRSASKRSRRDDHGPQKDPRGRQSGRWRVFDPPLGPGWLTGRHRTQDAVSTRCTDGGTPP